ncbi:MAG: molybdopterin-dependent oxidoreductase [Promethearchaeota archaeon]|nr:MAG: molybdopterin-dependent oxidoreductase [Candidatus Lokiarchaeota archaeon]
MTKKNNSPRIRFGTCSKDCYGSCVFKGIWNDEALEYKFISANPLKEHPFTNGFFCPKFKHRESLVYHQERLKFPLNRKSPKPKNKFEQISLDKALDIIAEKLSMIRKNQRFSSILGAFYSGNSGLISQYAPLRFFREFGATITSDGICNEGGCAGLMELFGTYSTTNPFQLKNSHTKLIVIWGSNLSESNNHAYYLVKQAVKNGAKLVVIDSRHTKIAEKADCFLHVFPGMEYLLVKVVINELITHDAYDEEFLNNYVDSYSSVFLEVDKIDKRKILSQIGISDERFHNFIELLIEFKHQTLFNIGYGIQKDYYGGRIVKTIALIQILLGNLGKPGTGVIYSQSDFLKPILQPLIDYISNNNAGLQTKEIPIIKLGSYLSTGKFKILFLYNFNPASSLPNQNLLRRALLNKNLFIVVIDMFLNETTKYADIVIPAKFDLESNDLISAYYVPGISINVGGPCPYHNCVTNYEFFQQLAWKLSYEDKSIFQESEETIFKNCIRMLPLDIQEVLNNKGYYLLFNDKDVPYNNLEFPTPNNRIQALGPHFKFGANELKRKLKMKENEFLLLSPSHFYFLHSQLGPLNSKYLNEFNKVFLTFDDIKNLNLEIGEEVIVSNEFGTGIYILAESQIIKPRTALIYSGLSSTLRGNPNVNFFIPDEPEELGLSGAYNSAIIKIKKIGS